MAAILIPSLLWQTPDASTKGSKGTVHQILRQQHRGVHIGSTNPSSGVITLSATWYPMRSASMRHNREAPEILSIAHNKWQLGLGSGPSSQTLRLECSSPSPCWLANFDQGGSGLLPLKTEWFKIRNARAMKYNPEPLPSVWRGSSNTTQGYEVRLGLSPLRLEIHGTTKTWYRHWKWDDHPNCSIAT